MKFFYKNKSGFTFVELLIYVSILSLSVLALVSLSISILNARNKNFVVQEVNANTRIALQTISRTMRSATGVNTTTSQFGTDPGVLSLSSASAGEDPTIIQLDQDNGILQIKKGTDDPVNVVSDKVRISNLQFTNLTGNSRRENIRIQMTVEYYNPSGDQEFSFSRSITSTMSIRI